MKIGILVREETMMKCTGKGCLSAFFGKKDAFARYEGENELLTFTHVGGDIERKIEKMREIGIETIHLSSCLRAKSSDYNALMNRLSKDFNVVGYTHGSETGSSKNQSSIQIVKSSSIIK